MLTAPGRNETLQGNFRRKKTEHQQYQLRSSEFSQSMVCFTGIPDKDGPLIADGDDLHSGLEMGVFSATCLFCLKRHVAVVGDLPQPESLTGYFARAPRNGIWQQPAFRDLTIFYGT